jgi:hypothetical protein
VKKSSTRIKTMASCPWIVETPTEPTKQ